METTIKDSGNRTQFSTGAVRDIQEDKGRCDLLPLEIVASMIAYENDGDESKVVYRVGEFMETGDVECLYQALEVFCHCQSWSLTDCFLEVSMHYKQGALKYGERNWEKGIPLHSFIDSAVRHYLKHIDGCKDERHDRAFVWNILGALWTMEYKAGTELIDVPFELVRGKIEEIPERKEDEMQRMGVAEYVREKEGSSCLNC